MNPATNEASLNLYALISLYNNVGRVWKDSFLKKDIIVKSPKLNAEAKEKTKNMFFLISGNIIEINFLSFIRNPSFISWKFKKIFFNFVNKIKIEKGIKKIQFIKIIIK